MLKYKKRNYPKGAPVHSPTFCPSDGEQEKGDIKAQSKPCLRVRKSTELTKKEAAIRAQHGPGRRGSALRRGGDWTPTLSGPYSSPSAVSTDSIRNAPNGSAACPGCQCRHQRQGLIPLPPGREAIRPPAAPGGLQS